MPDPVPGPGEALIAVEAHSVNRGEMFALNGTYGAPAHLHPEIGRLADWTTTDLILEELYQRKIRGNAVLTLPDGRDHAGASPDSAASY